MGKEFKEDTYLEAKIGNSEKTKIKVSIERKINDGNYGSVTLGDEVELELDGCITGIEKSFVIAVTQAQLETSINNLMRLKGLMTAEEVTQSKKNNNILINSLREKAIKMNIDVDRHISFQ